MMTSKGLLLIGVIVVLATTLTAFGVLRRTHANAIVNHGIYYLQHEQTGGAITTFQEAVDKNPESARAHFYLGLAQIEGGKLDEAEANFKRALTLGNSPTPIKLAQCAIYTRRQEWSKALTLYDQVLRDAPPQPEVVAMRGECYLHLKQYEEAIADFSKALESIKDPPQASLLHANRGYALMNLNKKAEALDDFDESVRLSPEKEVLMARGDALAKWHQYERALKDYAQVIALDENNYHAFVSSGACYAALKQDEKALEYFNIALGIDPNGTEALKQRDALQLRRKKQAPDH